MSVMVLYLADVGYEPDGPGRPFARREAVMHEVMQHAASMLKEESHKCSTREQPQI